MLDTNALSAFLKQRSSRLDAWVHEQRCCLSAIAASELDPAGFQAQLALEQGMGVIRETAQDGQVLLEAVG